MFKKLATSAILALGIGVAGIVAMPSTASAGSLDFGIYVGSGPYYGGYHKRHYRGDRGHYRHRACGPRRAVRKAVHRFGIRNAHVVRVNHNRVVVAGRKYGHRAKVVFARQSPHCAVIRARGVRW